MNEHQRRARQLAYRFWLDQIESRTVGIRRAAIRQSALLPAWLAVEQKLGDHLEGKPPPAKPSAAAIIAQIDAHVARSRR